MTLLANPFVQVKAAAQGNLEAMRQLADHAVALVRQGLADPSRTLIEGLVFARMAATIGDVGDKGRAMGMLALLGSISDSEDVQNDTLAESMAMAFVLADAGTEWAEIPADGVNLIAEHATPEDLERARIYVPALKEVY